MLQRMMRGLTAALLAACFGGSHSFAGPLEDGLSTAGAERNACEREFYALRQAAEERGKLLKTAGMRRAAPEEACQLIQNYGRSEIELLYYVAANAEKCGFPSYVADQLKAGHKNTETMQTKVCALARQIPGQGPTGPAGDFDYAPIVR